MSEQSFVIDAMVLIDLAYAGGLTVLQEMGQPRVLDVVLSECSSPKQPNILNDIRCAGIVEVKTQMDWLFSLKSYRAKDLSIEDSLCLYYAKVYDCILLTNEKPLRQYCKNCGVTVHGSLWVVQEAFSRGLRSSKELLQWLKILVRHDRWFPKRKIQKLQKELGGALKVGLIGGVTGPLSSCF